MARESRTYSSSYPEGAGDGIRYTAFNRYEKLAQQSLQRMQDAQAQLAAFRVKLKPLDSTEQQLREFRQTYDAIPWSDVEAALHSGAFDRPAPPGYADYVDRIATGQEELIVAFQELFDAPTLRQGCSLALAAFIDMAVFLLAYASGPYFFDGPEQRWFAAGASLDARDEQVFVRDFLRKFRPDPAGVAHVEADRLTPGELQVCCLYKLQRLATVTESEGRLVYLLSPEIHEQLLESLASPGLPLRASAGSANAG